MSEPPAPPNLVPPPSPRNALWGEALNIWLGKQVRSKCARVGNFFFILTRKRSFVARSLPEPALQTFSRLKIDKPQEIRDFEQKILAVGVCNFHLFHNTPDRWSMLALYTHDLRARACTCTHVRACTQRARTHTRTRAHMPNTHA